MHQRLWRLLGDCERLARDETAALTHRNFPVLIKTQQVKAALLADLASEATLLHASANSPARARLEKLLDCNRRNSSLLAGMMESARAERRNLRSGLNQLRSLRASYRSRDQSSRPALLAHV